jgi:signal transduction histidine kinase
MTTPQPPPASADRLLGIVRWLLPLGLAVIAVVIEWTEHIAGEGESISLAFLGEVALFGLVGPVAVALTLSWVARIIEGYRATAAALESMNRSLEAKVAERTRHLEEATAKLAAANENLRQLDRMKSEFVSLVSHQLRAPLTNINGALEIVGQDAELLPPASRRTLQILTFESHRLSRLIQTILDVSRIESGRLTLRMGPVAIEPLLARACAATLEAEPGRPLSFDVPVALPPAWADEILVEEVIRNIVENALRYSPAGTPIDVSALARNDRIEIAVADHGPGVPESERDQIFSSFYRLGDTETTATGYGLGLYFADKLVRAQQGEIAVESPAWPEGPQPGSRFIVTLPIAPPDPDDPDWGRTPDPDDAPSPSPSPQET